MAVEKGIVATVISASTQQISGDVYGSMLLGLPASKFEEAMDYLSSFGNLSVEEVTEIV